MENMNIIATEETLTEALESIDYSTGYVEGSDQDQAEGGASILHDRQRRGGRLGRP